MKSFIIGMIGVMIMLLGGLEVFGRQRTQPVLPPRPEPILEQASTIDELTGTWYAFPVGLLLQFNNDESAQFGLNTDGTTLGYDAIISFEGELLSIRFTNYDGENAPCHEQAGLYTVQLHQGGQISFDPARDDCLFRLESLSGSAEADFRLIFHQLTK